MRGRILIADDEKGIISVMRSYFEMSNYQVFVAYSGKEVLKKVSCKPDIILLDINMPELDGISACRQIREFVTCPILFLTARIESKDKIMGFNAGADDYIVKPFDMDELGARVEAHLRRDKRKQEQSVIRIFGELVINYSKREIFINNEIVTLSKLEFDIVELLSINSGQVFERDRIYNTIWGINNEGSSDTIMEHIRKIRAKIGFYTVHNYIETVWGVGYKWNG